MRHAGQKVILLVKRDGGQIQFRLRAGVGDWVDRAPWRIEWGGGSSIENPHYQRVHYCQLLVCSTSISVLRLAASSMTSSKYSNMCCGSKMDLKLTMWAILVCTHARHSPQQSECCENRQFLRAQAQCQCVTGVMYALAGERLPDAGEEPTLPEHREGHEDGAGPLRVALPGSSLPDAGQLQLPYMTQLHCYVHIKPAGMLSVYGPVMRGVRQGLIGYEASQRAYSQLAVE